MNDDLPAPLTPPECDLRDFQFMPLEVNRLRKSKAWLWARRAPELGFYMLNLWAAAWHETPAASLEDDDDVLADAAMCDPRKWPKIKERVMHGWIKCSDGRLYHSVVAEKAIGAWSSKNKQRARTAAATKARQSTLTVHNLSNDQRNDERNDTEREDRNVDRNDDGDDERNGDGNDNRNVNRDDNATFTKGQGREGKGQGLEDEEDARARTLLSRICEILRLDLQANPGRIAWLRQVSEMLRDGLEEPEIIAATEVCRTHGKVNLAYIRAIALNPKPQGSGQGNGTGRRESNHEQAARVGAELIAELDARDRARDHSPLDGADAPLRPGSDDGRRISPMAQGFLPRPGRQN